MSFVSLPDTPTESIASPPATTTLDAKPTKKRTNKKIKIEKEHNVLIPSVRRGVPLVDSYSYHSVDVIEVQEGKGKKRARQDGEEDGENKKRKEGLEWMLGVDEAGRGPVLGPQVYGIAFCPVRYEEELKSLGFADSKTLTAESREGLLDVMIEHGEDIKWSVRVMSPHDLSRGMLRRNPYNLNAQSHDTTIQLIQDIVQRGYNLTQVFVDTVGPPIPYQEKLQALFPTLQFTVCSKADSIYPIVSAASIAAKVTRDKVMEEWCFLEKGWEEVEVAGDEEEGDEPSEGMGADRKSSSKGGEGQRNFGSGYPGDPNTVAWVAANVDSVFGYPNIARFSWQTVKTVLTKQAVAVKWNDEPATIQKYFTPAAIAASKDSTRIGLWKDLNLSSIGSF